MAKSQTAEQKQRILEVLAKNRGAALSLSDIALHAGLEAPHVLTLLGQLKGEVECVSRATMDSSASMKWEDVDSKWRIAGAAPEKAAPKWPPRPGSVPFGSETQAELEDRLKRNRLSPQRAALAAYLGHAGMRAALGAKAPEVPAALSAWLLGLSKWKDDVRVRGLAAAATKALPAFEAACTGDERPRRAFENALAWAKAPSAELAKKAKGLATGAEASAESAPEGAPRAVATAATRLSILVAALASKKAAKDVEAVAGEVARALEAALPAQDARNAVKDELGAWSLA